VRAFAGADQVLIVSTNGPNVVSEHGCAVEAAVAAGVSHIVYTSGVQAESTYVAGVHKQTEDAIRATGLTYTMLRNNMYADVLVWEVLGAARAGLLSAPVGEGKVTAVTRADCAAATSAVLATPGHENKIYDITGTESLGHLPRRIRCVEQRGRRPHWEARYAGKGLYPAGCTRGTCSPRWKRVTGCRLPRMHAPRAEPAGHAFSPLTLLR